jgi:DNA mismatch endonuclease, patch repair protein
MMAGIRGKDTKPEVQLRRALHAMGLRFRLHAPHLPGRPDIAFPKYRAAIFVHGCFWHRHQNCKFATVPATRPEFWQAKFESNIKRDKRSVAALLEAGWRVAIVWECALNSEGAAAIAQNVAAWLNSVDRLMEVARPNGDPSVKGK